MPASTPASTLRRRRARTPARLVCVVSVTLVAATLIASCGLAPDTFIGPAPDVRHPVFCDTSRNGSGCTESDREAGLYWAVAPATTFTTRISRTEFGQTPTSFDDISGDIELTNTDECDARLFWNLTADPDNDGPPPPPLTVAEPESASLEDYPIPAGTRELRLQFRRLDTNPCWAHVKWSGASLH